MYQMTLRDHMNEQSKTDRKADKDDRERPHDVPQRAHLLQTRVLRKGRCGWWGNEIVICRPFTTTGRVMHYFLPVMLSLGWHGNQYCIGIGLWRAASKVHRSKFSLLGAVLPVANNAVANALQWVHGHNMSTQETMPDGCVAVGMGTVFLSWAMSCLRWFRCQASLCVRLDVGFFGMQSTFEGGKAWRCARGPLGRLSGVCSDHCDHAGLGL